MSLKFKRSSTASAIPTISDIEVGGIAINFIDGKLYTRDENDNIISLSGSLDGHGHEISDVNGLQTKINKLDGIESGATADQTDSEIETAYNNQVNVVTQTEAETGTSTTVRRWTAQRVKQAILSFLDWANISNKPSTFPPDPNSVSTTELDTSNAPSAGQKLSWNGTALEWQTIDGGVDVSNNGTNVISSATDINFNSLITATDDTDGTVTVNVENDLSQFDNSISGFITGYTVTQTDVTAHEGALTITESQISDLGNYEPAFTKNAAFNKNFGTAVGTVAEGNDSRIINGQTAFGWGDHSTEGYVVGPASATDNAVARFDGTTGELVQNSGVTIDDSGQLSANYLAQFSVDGENPITIGQVFVTNGTDGFLRKASLSYFEGSLSITESQISDLGDYATATATILSTASSLNAGETYLLSGANTFTLPSTTGLSGGETLKLYRTYSGGDPTIAVEGSNAETIVFSNGNDTSIVFDTMNEIILIYNNSTSDWELNLSASPPNQTDYLFDTDIGSTVQGYDADTAKTDQDQQYTGAARGQRHSIGTQSTTVAWNMNNGHYGFVCELSGDASISNPINKPSMLTGDIIAGALDIKMDATGGHVPSWGSEWENTPSLDNTAGVTNRVPFLFDGTKYSCGAPVVLS